MNKCLFCGENTTRPKFCSPKCIKHAWYCKKHPNSFYSNSQSFWKSNTGIGFTWEKYIAKKIGARHLEFNHSGADLDWKGKLVDVKASNIYKRSKKGNRIIGSNSKQFGNWVFNRGKDKPIDFFCCVCILGNKPFKILMIPNEEFGQHGCVVGRNSKFDIYKI
jgi:hypothetical protein